MLTDPETHDDMADRVRDDRRRANDCYLDRNYPVSRTHAWYAQRNLKRLREIEAAWATIDKWRAMLDGQG